MKLVAISDISDDVKTASIGSDDITSRHYAVTSESVRSDGLMM